MNERLMTELMEDDAGVWRRPIARRELTRRERLERTIGRWPRRVAYPLIFVVCVALWTPIGIAAMRLAEWLHRIWP